ncbi:MAG: O-antigen ligase family protein [Oscillospiraceae bacterium]|nr:O-antigen ligase family protein [Oscillospiraceae bacterium]
MRLQKDTAFADGFLALLVVGSLYLPSSVCGIMIIVAAFYVMADFQKREKVFNSPYFKLLFGFLTLSFFVAACYKNYSGMVMTLMLMGMLVYGMYLRTVMVRPLFDKMLDLACLMSVPAVLVAIFQKAATFASNPSYRPVSFFENANYFGMMVEFTVAIILYRALRNHRFLPLYTVILGMNFLGLYLCSSMSALAAMTCGVLAFLLYKRRNKLAGLYIGVVVLFFAANRVLPQLFPRIEAITYTTDQRLSIWHGALQGIAQTPLLGRGMRAYSMIHEAFGTYPTYHCHNLYLDCLLNFGIIGSAVLVIFGVHYLREIVHRIRRKHACNADLLFLSVMVMTLVHGCTDVTISWTQTGMLFFILFSATGICIKKKSAVPATSRSYYYTSTSRVSPGYMD